MKNRLSTFCFAFALIICAGLLEISAQVLKTEIIHLDDCIETGGEKRFVIQTKDEFLQAVRTDDAREKCLESFGHLDFDADSLLGIGLRTGYCRTPIGLRSQLVENKEEKRYEFDITYIDPQNSICPEPRHYDLWLLAPKLPAGYEVVFSVKAVPPPND